MVTRDSIYGLWCGLGTVIVAKLGMMHISGLVVISRQRQRFIVVSLGTFSGLVHSVLITAWMLVATGTEIARGL